MIEVVPAIIPDNFAHLTDEVEKVAKFVSRIQVDVMDGKYAPSKSWPYSNERDWAYLQLLEGKTHLPHITEISYELDMMVENPEEHIDDWMKVGFKTLIIHTESTKQLPQIIEKATEHSVDVGLALKPATSLEQLDTYIEQIAFVQFMGNNKIGYHGVSLDSFVLPKISTLRAKYPELIIGIDIGVTEETVQILVDHGVNKLVSGSAIYNSEDIEETITWFKSLEPSTNENGSLT